MDERVVLITGSSDGIGKQTALELSKRNFRVIIHGRNKEKGLAVVNEIREKTNNPHIHFYISDFSSLAQVRSLASEIIQNHSRLDVLTNNAGVFQNKRILTEDRNESTFQINYLSHFLLTNLLLKLLMSSAPSRIINVSSMTHLNAKIDFDDLRGEKYFDGYNAYSVSKALNILFTYKFAEMMKDKGVTVNCLHPGVIDTKLLREGFGANGLSVKRGAKIPVYLATSEKVKETTGKYFYMGRADIRIKITDSSPITYNKEMQDKLWKISRELSDLKNQE